MINAFFDSMIGTYQNPKVNNYLQTNK